MKLLYTLAFSFAISFSIKAQITITSADMPNAGDTLRISMTNSIGSNIASATGANHTWNYSNLTPSSQRVERFDSPNTFTSPYNLLFNIFNTSYGKDNYTITSIPIPTVQITAAYDFYKESNNDLRQIGAGYVINSVPLPFIYNSPDIIYKFPLNYQNVDSSNYGFGLPIPSIGYYGQSGKRVNTVDGWGTLTTPYGTFQTLRVKSAVYATDTIFLTSLNFGSKVTRPLKYEYKWLAAGSKIPVLQIDANVTGANQTITAVLYRDSLRSVPQVGITETTNINQVSIYPNPATDKAIVSYVLNTTSEVSIHLIDMLGRKVYEEKIEKSVSGNYLKEIDVTGFSKGLYFVNLKINSVETTQKLIIK